MYAKKVPCIQSILYPMIFAVIASNGAKFAKITAKIFAKITAM